ncbi:DUF3088 family protein [Aestuariispira insulae]|uniref:DUF3088 family protein n=1 Tax=Aestuariispira insulae TaxID=1461337 RepID=A0A3D9HP85_9PROT|nr:DUF3088 family protein [Aestuariispira insulae]RED51225.1 hypothetical protein DFP90_10322 [Aestuariispira insulae]
MSKPQLFILEMPFIDPAMGDSQWFCADCALIEGALTLNPHWQDGITVKRIPFEKPRREVVDLLGEDNQWLPVLIRDGEPPLTDPVAIATWLAQTYGGASPHP